MEEFKGNAVAGLLSLIIHEGAVLAGLETTFDYKDSKKVGEAFSDLVNDHETWDWMALSSERLQDLEKACEEPKGIDRFQLAGLHERVQLISNHSHYFGRGILFRMGADWSRSTLYAKKRSPELPVEKETVLEYLSKNTSLNVPFFSGKGIYKFREKLWNLYETCEANRK